LDEHTSIQGPTLSRKKNILGPTQKRNRDWSGCFFSIKLVAKGKFPTLSPSVDDNKVIEDSTLKGEDHPRVKRCDQGLEIECKGLCRVEYHD
jgi:hypothetical protein